MEASDEAARLAELRRYAVLDTPPEPAFDELTGLASRVCSTPMALLSLVDADRQWFKAAHGLGVRETPRRGSFCSHAIQGRTPMVVADTLADERFRDSPFVVGAPHVRFYAGAPLVTPAGHALGALCVIDRAPRRLEPGQLHGLEALSRQVMALLELRRRALDLAKSEARFRAADELGAEAVAVIDAQGRVDYASPSSRRVLGLAPRQLRGRDIFSSMHPDDRAAARALLVQCVERPGRPLRGAFRVEHRDGWWHWIEADFVNRLDEPGIQGILASYRDVTERRHLEDALRRGRESRRAEALVREDLARTLVHDLRTPLTAVLGALEFLAGADDAQRRELIDSARANANRVLALVESLLEIGRLEGSSLPIERCPTRLADLLREAVAAQALLAQTAGVDLRLDAPAEACALDADPTLVARVVHNLLHNAIKFTPKGGAVRLSARDLGRHVEVEVRDTGGGVPEEVKGRLFEKFARGPQKERGTGLGLAFCRLAVEAHGGTIGCRSEPGRGAAFWFTLPRS